MAVPTPHSQNKTGKLFALGVVLFFVMVATSVAMMFMAAKRDAENRERHPVIGQP